MEFSALSHLERGVYSHHIYRYTSHPQVRLVVQGERSESRTMRRDLRMHTLGERRRERSFLGGKGLDTHNIERHAHDAEKKRYPMPAINEIDTCWTAAWSPYTKYRIPAHDRVSHTPNGQVVVGPYHPRSKCRSKPGVGFACTWRTFLWSRRARQGRRLVSDPIRLRELFSTTRG